MRYRLAMTVDGNITECKSPPDKIGYGRCNHIVHQDDTETQESFIRRVEKDPKVQKTIDRIKKKEESRTIYGSFGKEFEMTTESRIADFCIREWDTKIEKTSEGVDIFLGQDLIVLGVPIDITLDMDRKIDKRHITMSDRTVTLPTGETVRFAVRHSNGYIDFEEPVVIIGFDVNLDGRKAIDHFLYDELKDRDIKEILEEAMDIYFDTIEE